jgi:hypothetical protein
MQILQLLFNHALQSSPRRTNCEKKEEHQEQASAKELHCSMQTNHRSPVFQGLHCTTIHMHQCKQGSM